jgi:hypothetical protein
MSLALVAFLVSIVAGGFGALVGIGGGLIIVPVLTVLLGVPIKTAIAASLIGVIATSMAATAHYLDQGVADRRLGLILLVATAAGGVTGGLTAELLDGRILAALFGALLVFVVVQMLREQKPPPEPAHEDPEGAGFVSSYREPSDGRDVTYRAGRFPFATATSFVAGNVSGLLGVGGGIINVPTMHLVMGTPIRVATTTSTWMLGPTAAASATLYFAAGLLEPLLAAPVALGVFLGARVAARLSSRVSQRALRLAFIGVSVVFAVQMFARAAGL